MFFGIVYKSKLLNLVNTIIFKSFENTNSYFTLY